MASTAVPAERLPDVVLGRDREFARPQAMAQLAASERPDREVLLAQVLDNTYEPRRYRLVAAITLGRIATPAAERTLLRALVRTSDEALPEVLRALGRIGSAAALGRIEALDLPPKHHGAGAAAYAATLIAYRLGLPGHELPFPAGEQLLAAPRGETRPIEFGPPDKATAAAVLEALRRHPYGIAFGPATFTGTRCAGEINVICPNREFLGAAMARLAERKGILALAALQSPETGEYSISYVALSRPDGVGGVAITIHRCSGKLALAGTGRVAGAHLDFELRAVRHPGAWAVSVKGAMEDGRLQIAEAVSSTTHEPRRVPVRQIARFEERVVASGGQAVKRSGLA